MASDPHTAPRLDLNPSRPLDQRQIELVAEAEREQWLADNQPAIDAYNQRIESAGAFSDGLRRF